MRHQSIMQVAFSDVDRVFTAVCQFIDSVHTWDGSDVVFRVS